MFGGGPDFSLILKKANVLLEDVIPKIVPCSKIGYYLAIRDEIVKKKKKEKEDPEVQASFDTQIFSHSMNLNVVRAHPALAEGKDI